MLLSIKHVVEEDIGDNRWAPEDNLFLNYLREIGKPVWIDILYPGYTDDLKILQVSSDAKGL